MPVKNSTVQITLADQSILPAFTAIPIEEEGPLKGLILLQEAFGVNRHIRDVANRLANCGYAVIAPELFHRTAAGFEGNYADFPSVLPHIQALTTEGLEADLKASFHWLQNYPGVFGDQIASIGFCMGGRASFLANSIVPLKAAISFYGSGIAPVLLDRVPALHGPILFFWGGLDKHNPLEQRHKILNAMDQAGKNYINVEIGDADHGFFCNERICFNPIAANEAWALVLSFLENNMH